MKRKWMGILAVLLLASACRSKVEIVGVEPAGPDATGGQIAGTPAQVTPAADQPTITIANWEETQQLVARYPGKVVILDLWASW